jgi:glycosyl-4,4'-diaponeurosporenoate acyltransferase
MIRVWSPSDPAAVLLDAAVWAGWSMVVGALALQLPVAVLDRESWITRPRRWERAGRAYERVGIRRWKDRLPEAGAWLGGASKRRLAGTDREQLRRFAQETRRAELVHWCVAAIWPVFLLWNPPFLVAAMAAYAVLANAPCIAVQRFNRARIARVLTAPVAAR